MCPTAASKRQQAQSCEGQCVETLGDGDGEKKYMSVVIERAGIRSDPCSVFKVDLPSQCCSKMDLVTIYDPICVLVRRHEGYKPFELLIMLYQEVFQV